MEHENIEIDETVRCKLMELVHAWSMLRPVVAGSIVTARAGGNGSLGPEGTSAADRSGDRKGKRKAEEGVSDIPNYDGIDSLWALSMGELSEYIPSRAVIHLSDVLWEFMPGIVGKMKDIRPTVKGGYQIPLHKAEVHGNPRED